MTRAPNAEQKLYSNSAALRVSFIVYPFEQMSQQEIGDQTDAGGHAEGPL